MDTIKKLFAVTLLIFALSNKAVTVTNLPQQNWTPKSIVVKTNPAITLSNYFSDNTSFVLYIYKIGTGAEAQKVVKTLGAESGVISCVLGNVTGDYVQITLTLKAKKDKKWFAAAFKKAGLPILRYNLEPEISVDKM